jgi:hypothetical protein
MFAVPALYALATALNFSGVDVRAPIFGMTFVALLGVAFCACVVSPFFLRSVKLVWKCCLPLAAALAFGLWCAGNYVVWYLPAGGRLD